MAKWKKFRQVDKTFYDFKRPEKPTSEDFDTWGVTELFKLEDIIVKHNPNYEGNYTQLADPKDAAMLADSLASRFGHTNLVGMLGKWDGNYTEPKEDGDNIAAEYNLESVFHSDYKRHVEYKANKKTGKVTIKYVCEEPVPEKVIAKDLHRLYKALAERKGYFVKNPTAEDKEKSAEVPAAAETGAEDKGEESVTKDAETPKVSYEGIPEEHRGIFEQAYAQLINYVKNPKQFYDEQIVPKLMQRTAT